MLRCVRTREIGRRLLPVAHRLCVRHLAMEALGPPGRALPGSRYPTQPEIAERSPYLAQPEMAALLADAERLGIELHCYEADRRGAPEKIARDTMSLAYTNWREHEQARHLIGLLAQLDNQAKLLVWCGNSHHSRHLHWRGAGFKAVGRWVPMGWRFRQLAGFAQFAIDQDVTVDFPGNSRERLAEVWRPILEQHGGTAGFLQSRRATLSPGVDAVLLSLENHLE